MKKVDHKVTALAEATVYMPLLQEGTDVWSPVKAEVHPGGRYRIVGPMPQDEQWSFAPGSFVLCEPKTLSDGGQVIVASSIAT